MKQPKDMHQLDAEVKARIRTCAIGLAVAFVSIGLLSLWSEPTPVAATDPNAMLAPAKAFFHKGVTLVLVLMGAAGLVHSVWSCLKLFWLAGANSR